MSEKVFEEDNESTRSNSEKLYLDPMIADVNFIFINGVERVPAHKILLSVSSPVFYTMFYGLLKEKGDVSIVDASAEAFKEFLQFFYLGRVRLTSDHIFQVANLCKKYEMTEALKCCETPMQQSLTSSNMCTVYAVALLLEMENVVKFCEQRIKQNASDVLKSIDFLECDQKLFDKVLHLVSLQCSASAIVDACMDWAKAKCKEKKVRIGPAALKEQLKNSLDWIPFAQLKKEQFDEFTAAYDGFFDNKDFGAIIVKLMSTNTTTNSNILNCDQRNMDKADVLLRFEMPCYSSFRSNTLLLLTGFYVAKASIPNQCDGVTRIWRGGKELTKEQITIIPNKTTYVLLANPVIVYPNTYYVIELSSSVDSIGFRRKPLVKIVKLRDGIEISPFNDSGAITGLVFQKPIG